jgi:hypothetical protein
LASAARGAGDRVADGGMTAIFDGINKIKMILKAGDFPSANPVNHINPIKIQFIYPIP